MMYLCGGILITIAIFLFISGGIGFSRRINKSKNKILIRLSKYSGLLKYIVIILIGIDILITSLVVFWISGNVGGEDGLSFEQYDAQTTYIQILTPLGCFTLAFGIYRIVNLIGDRRRIDYKSTIGSLNDYIPPPPSNIQIIEEKKEIRKKKCEYCYFEISNDDKVCSNCGSKQDYQKE